MPTEFEVRSEGSNFSFYGYALKWDARSQNLGGFRERVAQGATSESIGRDDIRALFNHDPNLILGRNRSNTLRLSEDTDGLHYEVDMPDTTYARDLAEAMKRGDVSQSSFGFKTSGPEGDSWAEDEDGYPLRTLQKVALFDVSPVTYPAYNDSTSGVASRALELLAERRGISVARLDSPDAIRAAIRGEVEVPALEARSAPLDLHSRDDELVALLYRTAALTAS
ncbi:HK97 family phage prohead protease [Streptomyces sp. NBC_01751]|uniref:HK97 family phage prohead protease n=1 Tax=Streptomyces sp. NBC_01751 TaxID=2975929 RepID=UPI002DDA1687|nr:HK97 family phage prohead protease [Streptomyces sp. NBC_01751]WSD23389.1 HK97 family phage prohead protease [Streptomyces sp. NBC_01751]